MNILVPVKQVATLASEFTLDGRSAPAAQDLQWQLNEWDVFSLEAARGLVEAAGGGEIVVATVGPARAEEALVAGLARGAGRAVRIWDPLLEHADPLAVAAVLAALTAAVAPAPELILCGAQSSDTASASTGIALAGLLDVPRVAVVTAVERDGGSVIVRRELDGGAQEVLRLELPALLTVQSTAEEPRHPTLRAIKQAREKPLARIGLAELGLDAATVQAAAGSRTLRVMERPRRRGAQMLEGSPSAIATRIAEIVHRELSA